MNEDQSLKQQLYDKAVKRGEKLYILYCDWFEIKYPTWSEMPLDQRKKWINVALSKPIKEKAKKTKKKNKEPVSVPPNFNI